MILRSATHYILTSSLFIDKSSDLWNSNDKLVETKLLVH